MQSVVCRDYELTRGSERLRFSAAEYGALWWLILRCGGSDLSIAEGGLWIEADVARESAALLRAWVVGVPFPPVQHADGSVLNPPPPASEGRFDLAVVEAFAAWCDIGAFAGYPRLTTEAVQDYPPPDLTQGA
jgi:hypothetical protein